MLRVALITYLMVGTLAGPVWCCCTLARFSEWFALKQEASSESSAPRGCCHRPARSQKNESGKTQERKAPAPTESPCPCKEQNPGQMAAVFLTGQDARDVRGFNLELDQADSGAIPMLWVLADSEGAKVSSPSPAAFPGLTSQDILCAFQVFRC